MNLLMVSSYLPDRSWGAGTRSYYLLRALAREHTVSLLATADDPQTEIARALQQEIELKQLRLLVLPPSVLRKRIQQIISIVQHKSYLIESYYRKEVQKAIDDLLSQDHYDMVLFESIFIAGHRLPKAVPVIIDQHNIEHELLQRTYHLIERLRPITGNIRSLSEEADVGVAVDILASDIPGLSIDREALKVIADLGAWLDIDVVISDSPTGLLEQSTDETDEYRIQ